jgi:hypothetical protein
MRISPSLSLFLSTVLVVAPSMPAAGVDLPASGEVQEIHLRIVSPDSASQSGKQPNELVTVEVVDDHGSPVPNASVLFRLPSAGSSGVFRDGSRVALVYTDGQGIATIQNIHWDEPGQRGTIKITATKGPLTRASLWNSPLSSQRKRRRDLKHSRAQNRRSYLIPQLYRSQLRSRERLDRPVSKSRIIPHPS